MYPLRVVRNEWGIGQREIHVGARFIWPAYQLALRYYDRVVSHLFLIPELRHATL